MVLLRRTLTEFGIDLTWDNREVSVCDGDNILETYEASSLVVATEIMKEIEEDYHSSWMAFC